MARVAAVVLCLLGTALAQLEEACSLLQVKGDEATGAGEVRPKGATLSQSERNAIAARNRRHQGDGERDVNHGPVVPPRGAGAVGKAPPLLGMPGGQRELPGSMFEPSGQTEIPGFIIGGYPVVTSQGSRQEMYAPLDSDRIFPKVGSWFSGRESQEVQDMLIDRYKKERVERARTSGTKQEFWDMLAKRGQSHEAERKKVWELREKQRDDKNKEMLSQKLPENKWREIYGDDNGEMVWNPSKNAYPRPWEISEFTPEKVEKNMIKVKDMKIPKPFDGSASYDASFYAAEQKHFVATHFNERETDDIKEVYKPRSTYSGKEDLMNLVKPQNDKDLQEFLNSNIKTGQEALAGYNQLAVKRKADCAAGLRTENCNE